MHCRSRKIFRGLCIRLTSRRYLAAACVLLALVMTNMVLAQSAERSGNRRSQRVRMEEIKVTSPDGRVEFTLLPNAERLSFIVTMGGTTVIAPSILSLKMDGYDLASGVIFSNVPDPR